MTCALVALLVSLVMGAALRWFLPLSVWVVYITPTGDEQGLEEYVAGVADSARAARRIGDRVLADNRLSDYYGPTRYRVERERVRRGA